MKKFNEFEINESDVYDDEKGYQLNEDGDIAEEYAKKIIIDSMSQFRSPINTWLDVEKDMIEIFGEEDYRDPLNSVKYALKELVEGLENDIEKMDISEKEVKKRSRLNRDLD